MITDEPGWRPRKGRAMCAPACAQMRLMCYADGIPVDVRSALRRRSCSARSTGEILQDSTRSAMMRRCARRRRQLRMSSAGEAPGAGASPVRSLASALALHPSAHVAAMGRPIGGGLREAGCIVHWRARLRPCTIDPEFARRSIAREVEPATVTDQAVERRAQAWRPVRGRRACHALKVLRRPSSLEEPLLQLRRGHHA